MFMASLRQDIIIITFLPKALFHALAFRTHGASSLQSSGPRLWIDKYFLSDKYSRYRAMRRFSEIREECASRFWCRFIFYVSILFIARSVFVQCLRFRTSIDAVENIDAVSSVRITSTFLGILIDGDLRILIVAMEFGINANRRSFR